MQHSASLSIDAEISKTHFDAAAFTMAEEELLNQLAEYPDEDEVEF